MRPRLLLVAVLLSPCSVPAQTAPGAPPKLLNIVHEQMIPGKEGKYGQLLATIARAYTRANAPVYWLETQSLSGSSESLTFNFLDSFEDYEKTFAALGQAMAAHPEWGPMQDQLLGFVSNVTTLIATRRDDMGNRVDTIDFSKTRLLCVTTGSAFFSSGASEAPWVVYEVSAGAPMPRFVILQPLGSLKDAAAALSNGKTLSSGTGESNLYMINAAQSHMPAGFFPTANADKR